MKNKILILDDDPSILNALKTFLEADGYEVYLAESISKAKEILNLKRFNLYILDFYLKDGTGIQFLNELRKKYEINEPAIILTGLPSQEIFKESFRSECDFFLQKEKAIPDILDIIKRLLNYSKIGKEKYEKDEVLSLKPVSYLIDLIKENKNIERILIKMDAYPLFNYKSILNDEFSKTLEEMLFYFFYDFQGRVLPKMIEGFATETCADLILSLLCPFSKENEIREKARVSMINTIKFMRKKIKNGFHFFDLKIIPLKLKNKNFRLEIYHLLQMKEKIEPIPLASLNFNFYFQGIFETNKLSLKGYEIFSRPDNFDNVDGFYKKLEKLHIHGHMDAYNIEKIKKLIKSFPDEFFISINLSPSSLLINNFSRNVIKELGNHSKKIFLEFTERTPLLTDKKVKEKITYLKKNGFLISIDDVGAGYNNISAILSIEPDLIKIDKVIVKNISIDSYKREAFKSILDLSKKMGSFVCAEGVEKEEDFLVLKELKPDYMQGYFLHFPEKMFQSLEKRKVV